MLRVRLGLLATILTAALLYVGSFESSLPSVQAKGLFIRSKAQAEQLGLVAATLGNIGVISFKPEFQPQAAALRDAGIALVEAADESDFDKAKAAFGEIVKYPDGITSSTGSPMLFPDFMTDEQAMKVISSINSKASEAAQLNPGDFRTESKKMAYRSLLLLYLGIIEHASDYSDADDWHGWCDEMILHGKTMARSYHQGDSATANDAHSKLQSSCNNCHTAYR